MIYKTDNLLLLQIPKKKKEKNMRKIIITEHFLFLGAFFPFLLFHTNTKRITEKIHRIV